MVERNFELYKNHFILYTKGIEPTVIDKPCSSLDILPTISNLMGLDYDSRLFMGRDIFSDSEPLVIFENKSFITDKGFYNSINGIFTLIGEKIDEDYINTIKDIVDSKFYYSAKILETVIINMYQNRVYDEIIDSYSLFLLLSFLRLLCAFIFVILLSSTSSILKYISSNSTSSPTSGIFLIDLNHTAYGINSSSSSGSSISLYHLLHLC